MNRDLTKIKPGDEVLVRMTAKRYGPADYRGLPYVVCEDPYGDLRRSAVDAVVLAEHIVSHTPKPVLPLMEDDDVRWIGGDGQWRILAIHQNWAWVNRVGSPTAIIKRLADLERAS